MLLTIALARPLTGTLTSAGGLTPEGAPVKRGRGGALPAAEGAAPAPAPADGAAVAAFEGAEAAADEAPPEDTNARMSSLVTRPSLPLPLTAVMSTEFSLAILRTAGVARARFPPTSSEASVPWLGEDGDDEGDEEAAADEEDLAGPASSALPPSPSNSISRRGLPVGAISPTLYKSLLTTPATRKRRSNLERFLLGCAGPDR